MTEKDPPRWTARGRGWAAAAGLAAALAVPVVVPASAQQFHDGSTSFYIDGSVPVDERTRDAVEAYIEQKRIDDAREAERREKEELFIFKDRIYSGQSYGRY